MKPFAILAGIAALTVAGCAENSDDGAAQASPVGAPAPIGTATASILAQWSIPNTRTDGAKLPLSALAGYELRYRRQGDDATGSVRVNDQTATSHTVTGLAPGAYSISIAAIDTDGLFSPFAGPIVVTIPQP